LENSAVQEQIESNLISCIVPARNEEGHLKTVIEEIISVENITEVIIVEGGSTDETYEKALDLMSTHEKVAKVLKQAGKGKFDAVMLGSRECSSELIVIWDADGTVPLSETQRLLHEALDSGLPVIGNRLIGKMEKGAMFRANFIANWLFAVVWSPLLGYQVMDLLCGTKIFPKKVFENIPQTISKFDPYGDFTLLISAKLLGYRILSRRVNYNRRRYGQTNIRRWSGGVRLFWVTILCYREVLIRKFQKIAR
jgi:glycosyltransferase involved in cell wall biosynthesis